MNRRNFLKILGISSLSLSAVSCANAISRSQDTGRPNILFIFSDDHAVQAISAYGSKINKTPNIDRIANEGITLDRCFCCNSICAPSRAAILTGKHSHANGQKVNGTSFNGKQMTFPKLLQKAGYQTALIGKWHLQSNPTGFDHWEILPGQGNYYNPDFRRQDGKTHYNGYATDITTDLSLDWLKHKRDPNKPFMMMCQHKAPHRVWAPGPKHLTLYDDVTIPEPETLFDDYANRNSTLKKNEMEIGRHMMMDYDLKVAGSKTKDVLGRAFKNPECKRMTAEQRAAWDAAYEPKNEAFRKANLKGKDLIRWKYQRYIKDYLRCVASVDENIGRMLDYLDKTGLAKNTLVIYSSDQGFYLGEHGWYDKRWMYEESFRMPFIARWPAVIKPGKRTDKLVQNIDFGSTFLDAAEAEIPQEIQGVSLMPILQGQSPSDWRKSLYYHYYEIGVHHVPQHYGVRTDRHKLIHYPVSDEWELFDLIKDPQEIKSVYGDPAYQTTRADLHKELKRLRQQYQVPEVAGSQPAARKGSRSKKGRKRPRSKQGGQN
ncbi:MAG: sulfatase [Planctomycetota bacterium]